mgnify:CR=1 FL=1
MNQNWIVENPENEYAPLVQELGGEVVNISVDSATHFNPLDFKYDKATKIPPHVAKAEFVLSLCEQIMGKEHILAGDKSLIDDALENIYKPLMESHYTVPCPTIKDLWMALNNQRDKRSKEIALALRIFATGSMQAFAQPTNVDMSNRLICFNIQSLGEQLKPVAMLSMLEYINTAVMSNERNDPKAATWVSTQQKTPSRRTKSLLLRMNCVPNYSTKLQRMFFKKLRENTFILMQMMTRLRRFADVGSRISTCFLRIGVHAERFTPQNKRKEAFSMICPLYSFQCFISLFAI